MNEIIFYTILFTVSIPVIYQMMEWQESLKKGMGFTEEFGKFTIYSLIGFTVSILSAIILF